MDALYKKTIESYIRSTEIEMKYLARIMLSDIIEDIHKDLP